MPLTTRQKEKNNLLFLAHQSLSWTSQSLYISKPLHNNKHNLITTKMLLSSTQAYPYIISTLATSYKPIYSNSMTAGWEWWELCLSGIWLPWQFPHPCSRSETCDICPVQSFNHVLPLLHSCGIITFTWQWPFLPTNLSSWRASPRLNGAR